MNRNLRALIAICLSLLLLLLGIFAPVLSIEPRMDGIGGISAATEMISAYDPKILHEENVSIFSGIIHFFADGDYFIATIILTFSILFPVFKLFVLWHACLGSNDEIHKYLQLVKKLGKLSMLDVLVMALIVVIIKTFPGRSQAHLQWGIYAFAASVLISLYIPKLLEPPKSSQQTDPC